MQKKFGLLWFSIYWSHAQFSKAPWGSPQTEGLDLKNTRIGQKSIWHARTVDRNIFLTPVVHFQGMHYTCCVNRIYHKKLIPKTSKWYYHDVRHEISDNKGFKTKGALIPQDPVLSVTLDKAKLRPYILLFRIVSVWHYFSLTITHLLFWKYYRRKYIF